ncbi:reverse transcriptase-like protein [Halobacillus karajensis]|uniref:reverse transcriptase-like protein n=1 Tax=Halobacillus karajensis TaxID=195088 RepID=UPI0005551205|nr:reverse transcriptase-like protein [Halobacillus karajensis]
MKVWIEVTYRTPKKTKTFFKSDEMTIGDALLIAEDLEKIGRAETITFIDQYDTTWKRKDLQKYLHGLETEPHNITVFFDGGFNRDDRRSGLGCVIYYEQSGKAMRLRRNALVDELRTNNEAEYAALHLAIQELDFMGVHHLPVRFLGDSQVVVKQLNDEWPTMEDSLNEWADRIENKLNQMGITPSYETISRKDNREADRLATQALNGVEVTSRVEID